MTKEYTDLDTILDIEVFDINNEQTTIGNLLNQLTDEEAEKLRSNINPANEILNWKTIDTNITDDVTLSEKVRSYIVGAIYDKEYEGKEDPKYYQKTKHWLLDMSDKELVGKAYEVGLGY